MGQRPAARWVLLIHQIPPKPAYLRVKVGRRLQRVGAVPIKNSVYVLPRTADTVEDLQWQRREIVADGGEASVCEGTFIDGLTDAEVEALFRTARDSDFREITKDVDKLLKAGRGPTEGSVARLRRRLDDVIKIDFFEAPGRQRAVESVRELETRLKSPRASKTRQQPGSVPRVWVTRRGVFVDRIASGWLIRRFIDPDARFKFVDPEEYQPESGEARFDMYEGEYTHEGDHCTFETLVARFGLRDSGLSVIAQIVHDIDCKGTKYDRAEAAGVERLLTGIARQHVDDVARMEAGAAFFDSLYAALRTPAKAPRDRNPRGRKQRRR